MKINNKHCFGTFNVSSLLQVIAQNNHKTECWKILYLLKSIISQQCVSTVERRQWTSYDNNITSTSEKPLNDHKLYSVR